MTASDYLTGGVAYALRRAEEYKALAQEHAESPADVAFYAGLEIFLRELAAALEAEREAA